MYLNQVYFLEGKLIVEGLGCAEGVYRKYI